MFTCLKVSSSLRFYTYLCALKVKFSIWNYCFCIVSYSVYVDGKLHGEMQANAASNRVGYQYTLNDLKQGQTYDITVTVSQHTLQPISFLILSYILYFACYTGTVISLFSVIFIYQYHYLIKLLLVDITVVFFLY